MSCALKVRGQLAITRKNMAWDALKSILLSFPCDIAMTEYLRIMFFDDNSVVSTGKGTR